MTTRELILSLIFAALCAAALAMLPETQPAGPTDSPMPWVPVVKDPQGRVP